MQDTQDNRTIKHLKQFQPRYLHVRESISWLRLKVLGQFQVASS